jgi:hypothetical protein
MKPFHDFACAGCNDLFYGLGPQCAPCESAAKGARIAELEAEVARLKELVEDNRRAADKSYWGIGWD